MDWQGPTRDEIEAHAKAYNAYIDHLYDRLVEESLRPRSLSDNVLPDYWVQPSTTNRTKET